MIEFKNVSVCYDPGARHPSSALSHISLHITPGEWVFLVGPSGAGKSTLLRLLHCSVPPTACIEGQILLERQDITRLAPHEIPFVRRKIGVVFQDFQLLAQKTAWENVAFALRVIGTPQSRIAREVPRALDIVGLAHRAHAQPHELSGGEQQRIAIARAIVNSPKLLLADEPTGNLDPDTASGIAEVLRRINEERGTTVVMATHDRLLVDSMRQRVVRVCDGKIASDETHGVYHPEDDDPSGKTSTVVSNNGAHPPAEDEATPAAKDKDEESSEVVSEAASTSAKPRNPKVRILSPQDAITRDMIGNTAPLGSDENPIVQYGRK